MLIATFSVTDLRRYVVDFSKPYYMAGQAILVRNDDEISSVKQLNGRRIIAVYGSTGEDSVKMNAPEAIIRGYKDYNMAYEAFKHGAADAMIADDTILYNLALDDSTIKILPKRFSKEPYAVAFRRGKESEQLREAVNFTIEIMEHSGKLRELKRKWGIW
jgi:putative glutamine transport system substrate-binding protein